MEITKYLRCKIKCDGSDSDFNIPIPLGSDVLFFFDDNDEPIRIDAVAFLDMCRAVVSEFPSKAVASAKNPAKKGAK